MRDSTIVEMALRRAAIMGGPGTAIAHWFRIVADEIAKIETEEKEHERQSNTRR